MITDGKKKQHYHAVTNLSALIAKKIDFRFLLFNLF